MKRKVMFFTLFLSIFALFGCMGEMNPSEKTEELLNRYIKNDEKLSNELNEYLEKQDLTDSQKEKYKDIIKEEYSTIKYVIKEEKINDDKAVVTVDITVKDLYTANEEAEDYLKSNPTEFYTDGIYDKSKFIDYKLNLMESSQKTVDYTISINLTKKDNVWKVDDLDEETLQKLHGIYNYSEEK